MEDKHQWPLYEVFVRSRGGLDHKHVGSLHAADARMALEHARDLYTRRQEGVSLWVVRSTDITASDPADADSSTGTRTLGRCTTSADSTSPTKPPSPPSSRTGAGRCTCSSTTPA